MVDRFFDASAGKVLPETIDLISRYTLSESEFETDAEGAFSAALFHQFEAFKQALDRHMTETVNPRVMRFLKDQEGVVLANFPQYHLPMMQWLKRHLKAITPCWASMD